MSDRADLRVIALVGGAAGEHLDAARRRFDPLMAEQAPAHVTVVYPTEAPHADLLRARLVAAGVRTPPFPLVLGEVVAHRGRPRLGVHHLVHDPVGVWAWLREFLLAPPFSPLEVAPHATIADPRTSRAARAAAAELGGTDPAMEFRVGALHLVATADDGWTTLERVDLVGGATPPP